MRRIWWMAPLFLLAARQDTAEERLREKLRSPFLKKVEWILDYDKAVAESRRSKKIIFGYFTVTGP